jgi:hypothetical protein
MHCYPRQCFSYARLIYRYTGLIRCLADCFLIVYELFVFAFDGRVSVHLLPGCSERLFDAMDSGNCCGVPRHELWCSRCKVSRYELW